MSPLSLRRYRADRLLQDEFEALRGRVLGDVRRRLASSSVVIAEVDLESCYSQAWHGLHSKILGGESVDSPSAWLATVCFRRALDEHRSRSRSGRQLPDADAWSQPSGCDGDFAETLHDRARLLQLIEGICATMSAREREAATLCLLHGMSRAEAARTIGIAPRRLERLMDGRGAGRPGVSAKLAALAETIAAGSFCEQRASSMRALALGLLDPDGERYRLAVAHQRSCPACRAFVLQLRGLAAALPPIMLPGVLVDGARGSSGAASPRRVGSHLRIRPRPRPRSLARSLAAPGGAGPPALSGGGLALGGKALAVGVAAVVAAGGALVAVGAGGSASGTPPKPDAGAIAIGPARAAAFPPERTIRHRASPSASAAPHARHPARRRPKRSARPVRPGLQRLAGGLLVPSPDGIATAREFGFERRAVTEPARSARRAASNVDRASPASAADGQAASPIVERTASASAESSAGASSEPSASASGGEGARLASEFGFERG